MRSGMNISMNLRRRKYSSRLSMTIFSMSSVKRSRAVLRMRSTSE
jgi:hypothetical protein